MFAKPQQVVNNTLGRSSWLSWILQS